MGVATYLLGSLPIHIQASKLCLCHSMYLLPVRSISFINYQIFTFLCIPLHPSSFLSISLHFTFYIFPLSQYNITILTKIHNVSQLSQFQPDFTISAKYPNISQISQYQPNITILAKYHNISQISQYQPNITISAKYHNISQTSLYQPNITISAKYHNISQISQF